MRYIISVKREELSKQARMLEEKIKKFGKKEEQDAWSIIHLLDEIADNLAIHPSVEFMEKKNE